MKIRVLMVCLGNICRSPLAEGVLKSKIDSNTIIVDSAGTAGYHIGNPPDMRSIAVAKKYGIHISNQVCRKFNLKDFDSYDIIYAMDKNNYHNIIQLSTKSEHTNKVRLLLSEIDGSEQEVPDPYYGGADGFEKIFQMIDTACDHIVNRLQRKDYE